MTISALKKLVKTHGTLRGTLVAALAAAVFATMMLPAKPSEAVPGSGATAIVSLGDSFISGEAGRWQGNSLNPFSTRDGTDRAASCTWWGWCTYDASRVYGSSSTNGCHRSDVATIQSAAISVSEKINLACSGAKSVNIWRASQGGQSFKGEAPQADQLLSVAQQKDVKLVVLTIMANDVGFADHVINCASAWVLGLGPCNGAEQSSLQAAMPAAMDGLRKSIDEVRATMATAGYDPSQWRFVIAGYASPIPAAADVRYSGSDRWWTGGCPFYDADFDWAKNTATPFIVDSMRAVAAEKGVQFLDVRDSLNGHEVCNVNSSLVDGSGPDPVTNEWVRWVNTGCCQGDAQESVHPNAYGQQAIGTCLSLMYAQTSGNWSCENTPGQNYNAMTLTSIP
ncbi:MAG: GDSL-type esterase/lipase family protein [Dehalococcoidia bacterium]